MEEKQESVKSEAVVRKPIRSFLDLEVYQLTYKASIEILTEVLPKLPKEEQFDLVDQLRRSCKAVPRLIAEGFSKRHQPKGFRRYTDDALQESNETIVSLSHIKDAYGKYVDPQKSSRLIAIYDRASRQIYTLGKNWRNYHDKY